MENKAQRMSYEIILILTNNDEWRNILSVLTIHKTLYKT